MEDLGKLLDERGLNQVAAGVLGNVSPSTISRILSGQVRARPATIVALARALGVSAKRMQRMCDAHYYAAHPDEALESTARTRDVVPAT
jgi:transcriptional regulator with XRE-family HTH domain